MGGRGKGETSKENEKRKRIKRIYCAFILSMWTGVIDKMSKNSASLSYNDIFISEVGD